MTEEAITLAQQILLVLLGAGITLFASFVQHRFAASREKTRLWREQRVTAYSGVLHALHEMKRYVNVRMRALPRGGLLDEKTREALQSKWYEGLAEVARAIDMGVFYVDRDAVNALIGLQQALDGAWKDEYKPEWDYLDELWVAINECLDGVRQIALNDLDVGKPGQPTRD